jgi:hypothetical protein
MRSEKAHLPALAVGPIIIRYSGMPQQGSPVRQQLAER